MIRRVLLVDDDAAVRDALSQTLELAGIEVTPAGSFIEAKDHITAGFAGIVVSDLRMPGRDGFHLMGAARAVDPDLPVILLTGEGDIPMAVRAMAAGAFDFLEKPCAPGDLTAVIERALRTRELVLENRRLKAQAESGDPASRMIFGHSALAEDLRATVREAARSGTEALVTGAPGTGISKIAEVVHLCSSRAKGPFQKRASEGMSRESLSGIWQDCAPGTLFLDDIGALPMDTQVALVDALEHGQQHGGARLVAGSTQDLAGMVESGLMSAELFYRLQVMPVRIPSLSERPDDIPVLFRHYVAQACEQAGLRPPEITPEVVAALMARDWPGNARALMSEAMRFALGLREADRMDAGLGLVDQLAHVERSLLIEALRRAAGRASAAAAALRLPRKTFYDKLSKYGLRPEDFR